MPPSTARVRVRRAASRSGPTASPRHTSRCRSAPGSGSATPARAPRWWSSSTIVGRSRAAATSTCRAEPRVRSASRTSEGSARRFCNAGAVRRREQNVDEIVVCNAPIACEDQDMDKDRIKGSAEQAKGAVKEAAGKLFGDKKLENEGKTDKAV